ncbi:MAG: hypothetical protein CBC22_03855 [Alphaproteobacteria bacterium TMED62]|nr:MAG: hypothetical protein CBC22_03855 [Alphaproteobacteria bacterium TMED62]|tara:strand:+ start:11450 stop:12358 length:909 start_codon:yes stop_codon:yes gene_type:complete
MSWKILQFQYSQIIEKIREKKNFSSDWKKFQVLSNEINKNPPLAISTLQQSVEQIAKIKPKNKIRIFDHGCGAGLKIIYLACIGYKNIYGVNVNFDVYPINKILKSKFKLSEQRFFQTEGKKVPFKSNFFDFIISCQVLEHLREDEIYHYYSEEGRVLKKNGLVYHEVPHKLIPYESHTRLWLIHLFPNFLKPLLYGIFISVQKKKNLFFKGRYYAERYTKNFLILRMPNFHKKMLKRYIGNFKDLTQDRLSSQSDLSSYDRDSPIRLRKLIQKIFTIPLLGKLVIIIFKNFFILQTLAKKK